MNSSKILLVMLSPLLVLMTAAYADNEVTISCEEYKTLTAAANTLTNKCPACTTSLRTEQVEVEYTLPNGCENQECRLASFAYPPRWQCSFQASVPGQPAPVICTITYVKDPATGAWVPGPVGPPGCVNVPPPAETNPGFSFVPNMAALQAEALQKVAEFCKCKDACDRKKTCQVDNNPAPSIDPSAGPSGVSAHSCRPNLTGSGAAQGGKAKITFGVKVKCKGECKRRSRAVGGLLGEESDLDEDADADLRATLPDSCL